MGATVALLVGAGAAAAHAEVSASDSRALAENVTLTFTSEAESDSAGIKELRIVLPEGLTPAMVVLKEAPKDWTFTASADGYTVAGPALAPGTDAEHSVVVRQLPNAKELPFKTVETYSDGKISRWIEVSTGGQKVENPAPVLELKPAVPGAKPIEPSPSPEPSVSSASPPAPVTSAASSPAVNPVAEKESDGGNTGVVIAVAAVVLVVLGAGLWWVRRRRTPA
ncbi:DUF1775 domain-containing protein [Streptomyces roseolus]|uniref:DUF1775 domain-containing protein n=1 Tax=Streptomyces roseolus TaxID=67358 RepID=UPI00379944B8